MKTLYILWKKLTDKDFKTKVQNAKRLWDQIDSSTVGRCNHFYNAKGEMIRGWQPRKYRFASLEQTENNPLLLKYR